MKLFLTLLLGVCSVAYGQTIRANTKVVLPDSTRDIASRLNDTLSIKDFGALADNTADAAPALNLALTAGKSVMSPAGDYFINGSVTVKSGGVLALYPGTYRFGNAARIIIQKNAKLFCPGGPESTIITVPSTWTASSDSVVLMENTSGTGTGSYGSSIEGCQFQMAQPDTSDLAGFNQYAGAWVIHAMQSRSRITRSKIVGAWHGIFLDAFGGSGSEIDDLQMASYNTGIQVDAATDIVRMNNVHIWPFGPTSNIATNNQITAFAKPANVGLKVGRCDGLFVDSYFSFAGLGIQLFTGGTGPAEVYVVNSGLEHSGISMNSPGSTLSFVGSYLGLDSQSEVAVAVGSGSFQMTGGRAYLAIAPGTGIAVSTPLMAFTLGSTAILSNVLFDTKDADQQAVFVSGSGSSLVVTESIFSQSANKAYTNSLVHAAASVAFAVNNNIFGPVGSGSRVAIRTDDGTDVGTIHDNTLQGQTLSVSGAGLSVHDNH